MIDFNELTKQFGEALYGDQRVGTLTPTKDENGTIHVNLVDIEEEWKLEDKVWVQTAPF
jgi:hypothetical protein